MQFPGLYARFGYRFHEHRGLQRRILADVRRHPERYADPDVAAAAECLRNGSIAVFSYPGSEGYNSMPVSVYIDGEGYPWVDHGGRRLYFRRGSDPADVVRNYRRLLTEQDPASPHFYSGGGCEAREGDVLLDVGAAEGIWTLDAIDRAARAFLFEVDPAWVDALERTFAPWRHKVVIVNRLVSAVDATHGATFGDPAAITIDTVMRDEGLVGPMLLKIDVEGAEQSVLTGATDTLARADTRAVVCTYHCADDYETLSAMMRERGFGVEA